MWEEDKGNANVIRMGLGRVKRKRKRDSIRKNRPLHRKYLQT